LVKSQVSFEIDFTDKELERFIARLRLRNRHHFRITHNDGEGLRLYLDWDFITEIKTKDGDEK
jgi:hypothetical protein